jgi:hypothetical protein
LYGYLPALWLRDRMAGLENDVFGAPPCLAGAFDSPSGDNSVANTSWLVMIVEGPAPCTHPWHPVGAVISPPTDDRPFPYLKGIDIPAFYPIAIGLMLLVSIAGVRLAGGPLSPMKRYLDLFFMGAAFLLLETKAIVQFALLFGTTWFVNALVFAGVLLVVLAGVEVARRIRLSRSAWLYPALFVSLAIAWIVSPGALLGLAVPLRFLAAIVLAFTPVFFANLIFSERFREAQASTVAFASNLLGAMVGGLLGYAALVTGYRSLLIVVAVLYLLALTFTRRLVGRASAST